MHGVAVEHGDCGPLRHESAGGREADPGRAAGDESAQLGHFANLTALKHSATIIGPSQWRLPTRHFDACAAGAAMRAGAGGCSR